MKNFKRIALIALTVLVCTGSAQAKFLNFGIKAGMNVNKFHFNKEMALQDSESHNSTGWEAGLMLEGTVPIIGIGFDVSLMYARMNNSSQGYYFDNGSPVIFNGENAGKNFIMLPVNLKYKLQLPVISKIFVPFIFTGPDFAFKLDKNIINAVKTKTCQVAWNVGLGIQLLSHLQVAASYGFGLTNLADKYKLSDAQDLNVKNNYWTITAAWLF